jgi:hypothetical protein
MRLMRWTGWIVITALLQVGPARAADAKGPKEIDSQRLAERADELAEYLEEFGSIAVSTPVLSKGDGQFKFDLDRSAREYYDDALKNIQAEAAVFNQQLLSMGGGLATRIDEPAGMAADARMENYLIERDWKLRLFEQQRLAAQARCDKARNDAEEAGRTLPDPEAEATCSAAMAEVKPPAVEPPPITGLTAPAMTRPTPTSARDVFARDGRFSEAFSLLTMARDARSDDLKLSSRAALSIAAGDRATQGIFNFLGDPKSALTTDRVLLYGVSMVSVQPGWRTQQGWKARVALLADMEYQVARPAVLQEFLKLPLAPRVRQLLCREAFGPEGCSIGPCAKLGLTCPGTETCPLPSVPDMPCDRCWNGDRDDACATLESRMARGLPLIEGIPPWLDVEAPDCRITPVKNIPAITAVSPMTETQTQDLASSDRKRRELALAYAGVLSRAGSAAEANAFLNFVKQQEKDVATRTPLATVSAFTSGHLFGFEVGPALFGIGDAGARKAAAANVLSRQSFPTLLLLSLDRSDLQPRLRLIWDEQGGAHPWRVQLVEPLIRFTQTPHWSAVKRTRLHRYEVDDLQEASDAANELVPVEAERRPVIDRGLAGVSEEAIRRQMLTTVSSQRVPLPLVTDATKALTFPAEEKPKAQPFPQVLSVVPSDLLSRPGVKQTVALVGKDLTDCKKAAAKSPHEASVIGVPTATLLLVNVTLADDDSPLHVALTCDTLTVHAPPIRVLAPEEPDITYDLTRTPGNGERHEVTVHAPGPAEKLAQELIRSSIEREKPVDEGVCPATTVIEVGATSVKRVHDEPKKEKE